MICARVGSVAQLAEQGIHKPRVTGSSPVAAIYFRYLGHLCKQDNADASRRTHQDEYGSRAELREAVNHLAGGVIVADAKGKSPELNLAALRLHGYASEEEVRRNVADFTRTFVLRSRMPPCLFPNGLFPN